MNIQGQILFASGSFSVGIIALFFGIIQIWLYLIRREQPWHLWGMLVSLATAVFAFGVYLQYFGQPDEMNRIAEKLQMSAILLLVHFAFGFTCSYLGLQYRRIYHVPAALFHILILVVIWQTDLIVSSRFVYRHFLLLESPYVEPQLEWLGNFLFAYISVAVVAVFFILVAHLKRSGTSNNLSLYLAGFIFWLVLGMHDILATLFHLKTFIFVMEYGFLGFSVAVIMVLLKNNLEFSSLAEQRAQSLLREKERYEAVSEVIFDYAFAFRVTPDGSFVADWVVGPIEKITGYTAEELSDIRTRKQLIHPEDRGLIKGHTERLLCGKTETIEFRIITKAGQLKWMCDHGRSLFDPIEGRATFVYGAMQDITERRRAEDALRENEKKYRLLVENANDAIFIIQNERIIFPNPRALEMTGYTESELLQLNIGQLVLPDDRDRVVNNYAKRILGHDVPHTYTFRLVTRQGEVRNVQINAVRINWYGQPATLNFIRDITTEKKLEEQLQQKNKYEAIGILAGGMSHDINNALTSIMGNIELLKLRFRKGLLDKENMDNHLVQIAFAVDRVTEQCRKLLAYARGGKYQLQLVNMNRIIDGSLDAVRGPANPRIRFLTDLSDTLMDVRADSGQMKMMIDAIVQNAVESIVDRGQVKIVSANALIMEGQIQEIPPGHYVRIEIIDTGIGMDETTRSKIFDPFFSTKFHGRGMSMAAVFGIVKNHRGVIQIDTAPSRGTAVRLYIPSDTAAKKAASNQEPGRMRAAG